MKSLFFVLSFLLLAACCSKAQAGSSTCTNVTELGNSVSQYNIQASDCILRVVKTEFSFTRMTLYANPSDGDKVTFEERQSGDGVYIDSGDYFNYWDFDPGQWVHYEVPTTGGVSFQSIPHLISDYDIPDQDELSSASPGYWVTLQYSSTTGYWMLTDEGYL